MVTNTTCKHCGAELDVQASSSRDGSAVKCASCGLVNRDDPKDARKKGRPASPWRLKRRSGLIETIDDLHNVHRRIVSGQLTPEDAIARGDEPWRPLGSIPELRAVFRATRSRIFSPGSSSAPESGAQAEVGQESKPAFLRRLSEELDEVSSVVEPEIDDSDVFLGASAPAVVPPGGELTIRFAAYVPEMAVQADEALRAGSRRTVAHPDLARARWKKGLEVDVLVRAKHLSIDPPVKRFKWSGALDTLVFDAEVSDDAPETTVVLKYDIVVDGIVVAALRHDLEIRRGADVHKTKEVGTTAARTAFASYASGDRDAVLHRVASLRIAAGLDVFQDCLSLRAGQEWKPQLSEEIRRSDLFLLFWSERAATSQWVEWEWRTALGEKEQEALQLHPLEPVELSLIPKELTHLHFEDPAMIIRDYYAGSSAEHS